MANKTEAWLMEVKEKVVEVKEKVVSKSYTESGKVKGRPCVCIFKVPQSLRDFKPEAFDPQVVPFGHFSRSKVLSSKDDYQVKALAATDDWKLEAVAATCQRLGMGMEVLVKRVTEWENEIINCYQDRAVEWRGDTLAWMMTMDACFILEFFKFDNRMYQNEEFSLIFGVKTHPSIIKSEILRDILKLENQIPLFVLIRILQLQISGSQSAAEVFAKELCVYPVFKGGFPFETSKNKDEVWKRIANLISQHVEDIRQPPFHLLDLWRTVIDDFLLPSDASAPTNGRQDEHQISFSNAEKSTNSGTSEPLLSHVSVAVSSPLQTDPTRSQSNQDMKQNSLPNVEKLSKAGISFEHSKDCKIVFQKTGRVSSKLSLPRITVDDHAETYLRNLMAWEECRMCSQEDQKESPLCRKISYFLSVLNILIESKEDVVLLREGNVIEGLIRSDQKIAYVFNAVTNGISEEKYPQYANVLEGVRRHHKNHLYRLIAQYKDLYFSQPWVYPPLVVGILGLALSVASFTYSVI